MILCREIAKVTKFNPDKILNPENQKYYSRDTWMDGSVTEGQTESSRIRGHQGQLLKILAIDLGLVKLHDM